MKPQGRNVRLNHCLFPCSDYSPVKIDQRKRRKWRKQWGSILRRQRLASPLCVDVSRSDQSVGSCWGPFHRVKLPPFLLRQRCELTADKVLELSVIEILVRFMKEQRRNVKKMTKKSTCHLRSSRAYWNR